MSVRSSWEAFGVTVVLQVSDPAGLERARAAVCRELDEIDLACSRFRSDSELCRVNARAGAAQRIGPVLAEAIELSLRAAALTDGAVDPTIGESLLIAGYDRDWALMSHAPREQGNKNGVSAPARVAVRRVPRWKAVSLDGHSRILKVPRGTMLELGAVAKAWAADRAAAAASRAAGGGALVAVGGDIAMSGPAPRDGWLVRVTDDHRPSTAGVGQTIQMASGGLATSSTAVRRWWHHGHAMHHIIDPQTGSPASSPWRTVSVAANSCVDANIAATAALVKASGALAWLVERRLPARLVSGAGARVYVAGWPRATERS